MACGAETVEPDTDGAELEVSASSKLGATKDEIKALGFATAGKKPVRERVRTILNDRISKLQAASPKLTEDEKLARTKGAWHQVWSDEENPQVQQQPGVTAIEQQVYQVVLDNGVGFNFGLREGPFGPPGGDGKPSQGKAIFIIRFEVSGGAASKIVTFTNTYARPGTFANLEPLETLAASIDGCAKSADATACLAPLRIQERQAGRFPRGPIGSQSPLLTDYIDGDFRVVTVPNSVTNRLDLFILERTKAPVLNLTYQDALVAKEKRRLRDSLRFVANRLQNSRDRSASATATLTPIFEQLSLLAPPDANIRRQLDSLTGAWRLLWSNENVSTDTQQAPGRVYQLVTPRYVFNLGERPTPAGPAVFALRTPITELPDGFRIKFDQAYSRSGGFKLGESLSSISAALESDPAKAEFQPRNAPAFPNGPIGATDDLRNLVLDGDLRVTQGKNASTGADEVFVLEKATTVK